MKDAAAFTCMMEKILNLHSSRPGLRITLLVAGVLFAVFSFFVSPESVSAFFGRNGTFEMSHQTYANILIAKYTLLASGIFLVFPGQVISLVRRFLNWRHHEWFLPWCPWRQWYLYLPMIVLSIVLSTVGLNSFDVSWLQPVRYLITGNAILLTCVFSSLLFSVVGLVTRRAWLAGVFLIPWALLFPTEILSAWYSSMRFDPMMIKWASPESVGNLVSAGSILVVALSWALVGVQGFLYAKILRGMNWLRVWRLTLLALIFIILPPGFVGFKALTIPLPGLVRTPIDSAWYSGNLFCDDPVQRTVTLLLEPTPFSIESQLSDDQAALAAKLSLPLGRPEHLPSPLATGINRFIFIPGESLNLAFCARWNHSLPSSITPVLDSLETSFTNVISCAIPTDLGLAVHFTSHPNYMGVMSSRYPNSFVRELGRHGWKTVFFRSAEMAFSDGARRFKEIGFQEMYGAEWQRQQKGTEPYISGWGACDRTTFLSATDYLDRNRDQKVFLTIMPADIHFPEGRYGMIDYVGYNKAHYADLEYPEPPEWVSKHPERKLLTSVFRYDHDLGVLMRALEEKKLLDESTLLVITADHAYPVSSHLRNILGPHVSNQSPIVSVWYCKQPLPAVDRERLATQTATAPTIFHLLGLPTLKGWFGRSLFASEYAAPVYMSLGGGYKVRRETAIDPRLQDDGVLEAAQTISNIILRDRDDSAGRK